MNLLCRKCNVIAEHSVRPNGKHQTWCKNCQRKYSQLHYQKHKKKHLERRKLNKYNERKLKRDVIRSLKSQPCQDCSVQYPYYVMQFDHRIPSLKSFTISNDIDRYSLSCILEEITKCDVVCANCHAERTWGSSRL